MRVVVANSIAAEEGGRGSNPGVAEDSHTVADRQALGLARVYPDRAYSDRAYSDRAYSDRASSSWHILTGHILTRAVRHDLRVPSHRLRRHAWILRLHGMRRLLNI